MQGDIQTQQQPQQPQLQLPQDQGRKVGTLRSWNSAKGYGVIRVGPAASLERYFLHVSKIKSGTATPSVGMLVFFRVSTKPVEEDRLPLAIDAHIDTTSHPSVATPEKSGGAL